MDEVIRKIQATVPRACYGIDQPLGRLESFMESYGVDMDPDYQRGHVWTPEQQELFVGALIESPESMGVLIFNFTGSDRASCEVVDGKQRLTACLAWLRGTVKAVCPCGAVVWYRDLGEVDLRGVGMTLTLKCKWVQLSRLEVIRYYLRLNSGGTVHTEEELSRVRGMLG